MWTSCLCNAFTNIFEFECGPSHFVAPGYLLVNQKCVALFKVLICVVLISFLKPEPCFIYDFIHIGA
jgi:hypothetical protein